MHQGNALTAGTAVLVFLVTIVALWDEQPWWFLAPILGFVVLVPFVFFMVGDY